MVKVTIEKDGRIIHEKEAEAVFGGFIEPSTAFLVGEMDLVDSCFEIASSSALVLKNLIKNYEVEELQRTVLIESYIAMFKEIVNGETEERDNG